MSQDLVHTASDDGADAPVVRRLKLVAPMPGFPQATDWELGEWGNGETPFLVFRSVQEGGPSFLVVEIGLFWSTIDITIDAATVEALMVERASDIALYAILTLGQELEHTTANLLGPIVVNTANNRAIQMIRTNTSDSTREPLFH